MKLIEFARAYWRRDAEAGNDNTHMSSLVDDIAANAQLTREAIEYAVLRLRTQYVDKYTRRHLLRASEEQEVRADRVALGRRPPIVAALIEHGLTLMDMRLGQTALGDYTPDGLAAYGRVAIAGGKTTILRGRFAVMVAARCPHVDQPIRTQLTAAELEHIRDTIMQQVPDLDIAQEAFTVRREAAELAHGVA